MAKTIKQNAEKTRKNLRLTLDNVEFHKKIIVVTRNNRKSAVIVPIELYEKIVNSCT